VTDSLPRTGRGSVLSFVAGLVLIAAFYSLDETSNTIRVGFPTPWDRSTRGELYFWLGALFFLFPGAALVGVGLARPIHRGLEALAIRFRAATPHEAIAVALTLGLVGFFGSYIGNQGFLLDLPLTDDEGAARFGGRVLATLRLMAPVPKMRFAFEDLFFFERAGRWTSMDFPGALLPWAFAELTGAGSTVFRLLAAMAPVGVVLAVTRRSGTIDGALAGMLVLLSPMAALLSMTNHTFVASRAALSLGFGAILFVAKPSFARGVLGGLALGVAAITRPFETLALAGPLLAVYAVRGGRDRRVMLAGVLAGMVPFLVGFALYDLGVTGTWSTPRTAPNSIVHPYGSSFHGAFDLGFWRQRFGSNVSYNLLTLAIYFLGPLGVLLVSLGAGESDEHMGLMLGVGAAFALALLHDDRGVHFVGPIHYSDAVIPLAITAAAGARRIERFVGEHRIDSTVPVAASAGFLMLGLPLFTLWQASALADHAVRLESILRLATTVDRSPAVVLAPPIGRVRRRDPVAAELGSFVFTWPRPSPKLDEPVIVLVDSERARREVRAAFPRRTPYVLAQRQGRYGLLPLEEAPPLPTPTRAAQ